MARTASHANELDHHLTATLLGASAGGLWCLLALEGFLLAGGASWYWFMLWNLFLAAVPLLCAILLPRAPLPLAPLLLGLWLLFFPNAPYVLTDLIHLHREKTAPLWLELLMLLSFALVSLWMGLQSLRLVRLWVAERTSGWFAELVVVAAAFLGGFGVYLGRFLRWNSWDVASHPFALLRDIAARIVSPMAHPGTWGVTLGFGALVLLAHYAWSGLPLGDDERWSRE